MRSLILPLGLLFIFGCEKRSAGYDENGEKLTGMQMKEREEAQARRLDEEAALREQDEGGDDGPVDFSSAPEE